MGTRLATNFLYERMVEGALHDDLVGEDDAAEERARVARVIGEVDAMLEADEVGDDDEPSPGPSVDRALRLVASGADVIGGPR